jgi:hypothetical protein
VWLACGVVDPHCFNDDPDPEFFPIAEPDPDPIPDPDPVPDPAFLLPKIENKFTAKK